MPIALPYQRDSYHCCQADGEVIYERFLNSTSTCTHSILLHPVCPLLPLLLAASTGHISVLTTITICSKCAWQPLQPLVAGHLLDAWLDRLDANF